MNKHKLNNKGITLIELIVSFVIVALAVIYFYNMLTSVTKMYAKARDGVNHAAKVNYAFRLLDEAYKQEPNDACDLASNSMNAVADPNENEFECNFIEAEDNVFDQVVFFIDGKEYTLYKYPEVLIDNTEDSEDIEDENIDEEEE